MANLELGTEELNAVSGGLQRNPWKDATNQRTAAQNEGGNTFGGSLAGNLIGGIPSPTEQEALGGHPV